VPLDPALAIGKRFGTLVSQGSEREPRPAAAAV